MSWTRVFANPLGGGDTYRTRAAFMLPGRRNWSWITWTNSEPNKHAAIVKKAREIGAVGWDTGNAEHHSIRDYPGGRFENPRDDEDEYMRATPSVGELKVVARNYGFTPKELHALIGGRSAAELTRILHAHEAWRERNGLPAKNSRLSRGHLQDMLRGRS